MTYELTDAEREALRGLGQGQVPAVVERIVDERLAQQHEDIATAIEALPLDDGGWPVGEYQMRCNAANIVREYGTKEQS